MSGLSNEARTVLQAIEDLQFTGRPDPRMAKLAKEFGVFDLRYFDPVPVVALYGELVPFRFDLDTQLRLLETEEAVVHSVGATAYHMEYIRPDGKIVTVDDARDEEITPFSFPGTDPAANRGRPDRVYFAAIDGQRVIYQNIHLPRRIEDRVKATTRHGVPRGYRIDAYRITKAGRAMLRKIDTVIDVLVTLAQVSPLTGLSKRTLESYLHDRKLPRPDVPGGGGKSNKWYWSKIRPSLQNVSNRPLPVEFPAGRIKPSIL
jgi:predicted DNA-binding transcriptional regulator AlpA